MTKRTYGWRKDDYDERDFTYRAPVHLVGTLPSAIDLRPLCSPVENQGAVGSCTGNALAGAIELLDRAGIIDERADPVMKASLAESIRATTDTAHTGFFQAARTIPLPNDGQYEEVSRLFLYYNGRAKEGTTQEDAGAQIRTVVKQAVKIGCAPESAWPYNPDKVFSKPGWMAYWQARSRRIKSYHRVTGLRDVLTCLAAGFPVIFGFMVYQSFESDTVARTGIMPVPDVSHEECHGGHAVLAVGYLTMSDRLYLIVRNSWGAEWGVDGYFLMPGDVVIDRTLSSDFWVVKR